MCFFGKLIIFLLSSHLLATENFTSCLIISDKQHQQHSQQQPQQLEPYTYNQQLHSCSLTLMMDFNTNIISTSNNFCSLIPIKCPQQLYLQQNPTKQQHSTTTKKANKLPCHSSLLISNSCNNLSLSCTVYIPWRDSYTLSFCSSLFFSFLPVICAVAGFQDYENP